jgi:hypothetical protein
VCERINPSRGPASLHRVTSSRHHQYRTRAGFWPLAGNSPVCPANRTKAYRSASQVSGCALPPLRQCAFEGCGGASVDEGRYEPLALPANPRSGRWSLYSTGIVPWMGLYLRTASRGPASLHRPVTSTAHVGALCIAWLRRPDSNRQPEAYEAPALPLRHAASRADKEFARQPLPLYEVRGIEPCSPTSIRLRISIPRRQSCR